jgi:septum formation protein
MLGLPTDTQLVLASASPRRAQLLTSAGLTFEVAPADIDESTRPGEDPSAYVARLSAQKAATIAATVAPGVIVIAADTTVDVNGVILEKPVDDDDARRMLGLLSGRSHLVHTGVTVTAAATETLVVETVVEFVELSPDTIEWYVATRDWDGKAGGYGIQGAAAVLVRRIEGSVTNVIGLPLAETIEMLRRA